MPREGESESVCVYVSVEECQPKTIPDMLTFNRRTTPHNNRRSNLPVGGALQSSPLLNQISTEPTWSFSDLEGFVTLSSPSALVMVLPLSAAVHLHRRRLFEVV